MMSYYYKVHGDMSERIIDTLQNIDDYTDMTVKWLEANFNIKDAEDFLTFNEIPKFTHSTISVNPELKTLVKQNGELKKSLKDSKELITSWQAHKQANGYTLDAEYKRFDYAMLLRRMFSIGSINPAIDRVNKSIMVEVSEESDSKYLAPITPVKYFEERARLEKMRNETN